MPDYLDQICDFVCALEFDHLPPLIVRRAKDVLADSLAVAAAGAQEEEMKSLTGRLARPGGGRATLWGAGFETDVLSAGLINGTAGTFLELDEGNQFARGHPAIHVVPAAMAAAEQEALSGRQLILALVAGYEIGARLGIASKLRPSMHPHGTWGTIGAAVAVGKLRGYEAAAMRQMINVSSSLGLATSRRTMLEGGTVRNVYAGVSNYMGLLAHHLVRSGFTGERDGLATVFGHVVSETFDPQAMIQDLGQRFEIGRNYFKRHACCRYNHSALDALEIIAAGMPGGRIPAAEVAAVEIETYSLAAQLCDQSPGNMLAAKFSLPFAAATFLTHGHGGVACFQPPAVADAAIQALAKKVTVREDQRLTAMMPHQRPSRVKVVLQDGTVHEAQTLLNKGDFEDPYSAAELEEKYYDLASPVWGGRTAAEVYADIMGLEQIADVNEVTARLLKS